MLPIDAHLANLLSAWLQTAAADTAGVPTAADLTFHVGHHRDGESLPQLVTRATRQPRNNPWLAEIEVLHEIIVSDLEDDVENALVWAATVRSFLADLEEWADYIDALSNDDKAGWTELSNTVMSDIASEDLEDQRRLLRVTQTLLCRIDDRR